MIENNKFVQDSDNESELVGNLKQPPKDKLVEAVPLDLLQREAKARAKKQPLLQKIVKTIKRDNKEFRELIINSEPLAKRVALLINGVLENFELERLGEERMVGAIFKGKVQNREPGLQAAFVDIGQSKNAFLHYWDILPAANDAGVEIVRENMTEAQKKSLKKLTIKDIPQLYSIGTDIVVQITKAQIGPKGPRATTNIVLPGRYLVLMPYSGQCGISRKIEDPKERDRLKKILRTLTIPAGMGVIIRTAGEDKKIRYFVRDLHILLKQWEEILSNIEKTTQPGLVYREPSLVQRTIRDFLTEGIDRVLVDDPKDYATILESVQAISPRSKSKIHLFEEEIPIFERFNIERQIDQMFTQHVPLPSGGEIIVQETEALTAIDVNTGSHKIVAKDGKGFILQANLEAAQEITRQIRLRNIGGLIVMDFIDMKDKRDRKAVYDCVKAEMAKDKSKSNILPISPLGILQMTRQRHQESTSSGIYAPCPYCKGRGLVKSDRTMSVEIQRRMISIIRRLRRRVGTETFLQLEVFVNPAILERFQEEDKEGLLQIENTFNVKFSFKVHPHFHVENYKIINAQTGEELN
jgi:ribonuclease G